MGEESVIEVVKHRSADLMQQRSADLMQQRSADLRPRPVELRPRPVELSSSSSGQLVSSIQLVRVDYA